ncbi:MAG: putative Permease, family [Nitrospira sp.]|jgi:MFS family permease|nr:putative Permease, family [Nitrospira sp.]
MVAFLLTRNLTCLWLSQLLSQVADGITKLALLWFVYSVTGSALQTTMVGILQTVSSIVCAPVIGFLVDRLPKKPILVLTDLLRGVILGVVPWLLPSDALTVDVLYLLVFLYGVASAVFTPALSASVPFLVPVRYFTAGNAMLQSTTSIGIILGPIMSGIGIAAFGPKDVLSLNTLTYLASVALLLPMRFTSLTGTSAAVSSRLPMAMLDAFRFIFRTSPTLLRLTIIASLYTFGSAALTTLLPVYGKSLFHFGPIEVGYLWSSLGVGFLAVSLALLPVSRWSLRTRLHLVTASSCVAGVALILLHSTTTPGVAFVLMAIVGVGLGTLTPVAWGMLQELSPLAMLGRVMGFYTAMAMTTSLLGIWFFGGVTQLIGEAHGLLGIGLVFLLVATTSFLFTKRMSQVRQDVVASKRHRDDAEGRIETARVASFV